MAEMLSHLTGTTRLHVIIGDPIAQVKSPGGMTAAFAAAGYDGIVVPVQVAAADLQAFLAVASSVKNLDGIIITVPHKFASLQHCASATDRARFIGAVNIMRRRADGGWHGEMVDGIGFVKAVRGKGFDPYDKRALLVGAGGAGSAIAYALFAAGLRQLALHDADTTRCNDLIARLNVARACYAVAAPPDPTGFDLVVNASPAGMLRGDPLPVDIDKLNPVTFVGCVITRPSVSPVVEAARRLGCNTSTGTDMYQALQGAMLDFLLEPGQSGRP